MLKTTVKYKKYTTPHYCGLTNKKTLQKLYQKQLPIQGLCDKLG